MIRRILILLTAMIFVLITPSAYGTETAEEEILCTYRVKVHVVEADRTRSDGSVYLGDFKGETCSVRLKADDKGKPGPGKTQDIRAEVRENGARIVRGVWRFETYETNARNNLFEACETGTGGGAERVIASGKIVDGWNMLDITDFLAQRIEDPDAESAFCFRPANKGARRGTWLDADGSEILVTLAFPAERTDRITRVTDEPILDAALSALEKDHTILRGYDEVSGSLLTARWPMGAPYYYGGHSEEKVLHRYHPLQQSNYYKSARTYLCGFDCGGFLHWVEENAGFEAHDMLVYIAQRRNGCLPMGDEQTSVWWQMLEPGDMFVGDHGSFHVMMYIGTPRMYGLDAVNSPELADVLDAPLVIHCGENPFYYTRYKEYIRENGWTDTYPPDGGVTVSLLLEDNGDAPHRMEAPWKKSKVFAYYETQGTPLTVQSIGTYRRLVWFRPSEQRD